jgi:hypothetical protein
MRVARFILSISISFLLSFCLSAQQTSTSSPQALTFLQRSHSGLAGGQVLTDVTLTGTARRIAGSDDETGTVVLTATATGSSKIALSFASGNRNEVRTNSSSGPAGSWSGPDGTAHPISYHNLMTDAGLFPAFALANLLASQNTVATYVGQATWNGHSVQHLRFQQQFPSQSANVAALLQGLSQMDIYLDAATALPVSLVYNIHPDNDAGLDLPVEIDFSDYRPVNGPQVPFHVQKSINNSLALDLQFQNVTTNSGLTASSFSL